LAGANKFWNYRMWKDNSDITKLGDATNKYNCFIYACMEKADGGHYVYWVNNPSQLFTDEFVEQDEPNDVLSGDVLLYGTDSHASVVTTASGGKPTEIRWKNHSSGIYSYDSPSDPNDAFNTPKCIGTISQSTEINEQDWTWDPNWKADPCVYRDD
jgi:hypothetical protein